MGFEAKDADIRQVGGVQDCLVTDGKVFDLVLEHLGAGDVLELAQLARPVAGLDGKTAHLEGPAQLPHVVLVNAAPFVVEESERDRGQGDSR